MKSEEITKVNIIHSVVETFYKYEPSGGRREKVRGSKSLTLFL